MNKNIKQITLFGLICLISSFTFIRQSKPVTSTVIAYDGTGKPLSGADLIISAVGSRGEILTPAVLTGVKTGADGSYVVAAGVLTAGSVYQIKAINGTTKKSNSENVTAPGTFQIAVQ